jgi:hypothetical protein
VTHAHATASGESAALSRDLADFLIELSIALHKNAIYPPGHPLLGGAVDALALRLIRLLQERESLSLGVARQQLVIEGVVTAGSNSLLRDLAQRLHRHHLGAVKFLRGVARDEVADLLRTIAADAERSVTPLGLRAPEELRRWAHIRAFPLTYDQLELATDGQSGQAGNGGGEGESEGGARAAQLWVGLARAAMVVDSAAQTAGEVPSTDPVVVAKAIDEHRREVAYDQVIVGYLLQIAEELKRKGGAESLALQKRISTMVSSMNSSTLRRLLEMGGDLSQRRRFMLDAAQGMAVDAVMELVQAAAETSQQTISHSLVRLLTKLATHAEQGAAAELREGAESELRDHVQRLISNWTLDDPNPDNYRVVLEHMAKASPLFTSDPPANGLEPERIIQMSLELDSLGEPVTRAVDAMVGRGELLRLFTLVANAPECSRTAAALWRQLASPDQLRAALREVPIDFSLVDQLVPRLKLAAADPLLDALEASPSRAIRRKLLDLITQLGPEAATVIVARLPDERWFVVRNMLMLLADLGDQSVELGTTYARHPDARVRREAIRILLGTPATRERAICAGLEDTDERVLRVTLQAAAGQCPLSAVAILQRRVTDGTLDAELSSLAIAVIASVRTTEVLEWLMERAAGSSRPRLFRRPRLAPKSPIMLAALNGLALHWARGRGVGAVLALALGSSDVEIRNTVIATGHRS